MIKYLRILLLYLLATPGFAWSQSLPETTEAERVSAWAETYGLNPGIRDASIGLQAGIDRLNALIELYVRGSFGVEFEQDWLIDWIPGANQDRNYTQGTAFVFESPHLQRSLLFLPLAVTRQLSRVVRKRRPWLSLPASVAVGVAAFTPLKIDNSVPVLGDRPFANVVFLSTIYRHYNLRSKFLISTSFNYGWFGSNVANAFQTFAHRKLIKGRPTDISWEHQISRGGQFGFLFKQEGRRRLVDFQIPRTKLDVQLGIGYDVYMGWYTGFSGISSLSVGLLPYSRRTPLSVAGVLDTVVPFILPLELDSIETEIIGDLEYRGYQLRTTESGLTFIVEKEEAAIWHFEPHLFVDATPSLVVHNSFVLGQPHAASLYTLRHEDYNPFIAHFRFGLALRWVKVLASTPIPIKRWEISFAIHSRSPEIRVSEFNRWHHWGSVQLRTPLPFF